MNARPHPFMTIGFVVAVSLAVAVVLFKVLDSTGQFNNLGVSLGGGAAGFAFTFWRLQGWYDRLETRWAAEGAQLLGDLDRSTRQRESVQTEALAAAVADQLNRVPQLTGQDLSGEILEDARRRVETSSITVDLTQLVPDAKPLVVSYSKDLSVDSFLDQIFFSLSGAVKPFTYNKAWVLVDEEGDELTEIGTQWAHANRLRRDTRGLAEVGISPGIRLAAVAKAANAPRIVRTDAEQQQWRADLKELMDSAADEARRYGWKVRRVSGQQRPRLLVTDGTREFGLYGMPGRADRVHWVKLAQEACIGLSQDEGGQVRPALVVNAPPSADVQEAAQAAGVLLVWHDGKQFHNAPWHSSAASEMAASATQTTDAAT